MLDKLIRRVMKDAERQHFSLERTMDDSGQELTIARANIRVGDKVYPCDTAIDIAPNQLKGTEKVTFTTLISEGVSGEKEEIFRKVIEVLNYDLPGKLVHDHTDRSQDILYTTSERVGKLTPSDLIQNLEHHAQVKALITPELESLITQLGLEEKSSGTESEKFAIDWERTFQDKTASSQKRRAIYLLKGDETQR